MSATAAAIEARADELTTRSIELIYSRNPFWMERFGARGRKHSEKDARHHITYLCEALRVGPAVLIGYARWLQGVLTNRGMCSRHLAEHFGVLRELLAEHAPAVALLEQAEASLRWPSGDARVVLEHESAILERAVEQLYSAHPEWPGRDRCRDDFGYHISYLADAIANDRPEAFAEYVAFVRDMLARRGIHHFDESIAALREASGAVLPEPARSNALRILG